MSRITARIFLGLSLILALLVVAFSITWLGSPSPAWATVAAALAVVTSVISAWGALRVVELEEDRLAPFPYPHFDTTSRYGLMLLRVTNSGGGVAHHIDLEWDSPLTNSNGQEIRFSPQRRSAEIPVLMPGQSISMLVDEYVRFFGMDKRHEYSGKVRFKDGRSKQRQYRFVLDGETYRGALYHNPEELKTHHEIQKLPDALKKIEAELARIRDALKSGGEQKGKDATRIHIFKIIREVSVLPSGAVSARASYSATKFSHSCFRYPTPDRHTHLAAYTNFEGPSSCRIPSTAIGFAPSANTRATFPQRHHQPYNIDARILAEQNSGVLKPLLTLAGSRLLK